MSYWTDKHVLVTGGTGSWGQELIHQLLTLEVGRVSVYSRDEFKQSEMRTRFPSPNLRFFLGDIRDDERLAEVMHEQVDVVIHLAALKQVGSGEYAPYEFVRTNVAGTMNVSKACLWKGVQKALFVSSDKAVDATTLYGGTKFVAERIWLGANVYSPAPGPPWFSVCRFGNAAGSRGSVLRVWEGQIARGEPLTITDPNMSRFWITLRNAVTYLIHHLECMEEGGRVHIPPMSTFSIGDLAKAYAPHDYPIRIVGGRGSGEKGHEVLTSGGANSNSLFWSRLNVQTLRQLLTEEGFLK